MSRPGAQVSAIVVQCMSPDRPTATVRGDAIIRPESGVERSAERAPAVTATPGGDSQAELMAAPSTAGFPTTARLA